MLLALLISMAMAITSAPIASAEEAKGCATEQCHPELRAKLPGLPKGHDDCTHCHQNTDPETEHPLPGTISFALAQDVCEECHPTTVDYDYLHPPVANGDCQACHAFHNTLPSLLREENEQKLCYSCHLPVSKDSDTMMHGDVAKQQCTSCHTPHGSFFKNLLAGTYSTDFFNDYNEKQYALCFQCHKIDLLLHPYTSYNTNFRDGKKNLHYLHVNRESRGRACKLCHEIHAGTQPKLMAETVSFGGWEMPVHFIINDTGGQCTPGCHAQARYDRNRLTQPSIPSRNIPPETDTTGSDQ